ncbi:MAG: transglutaminase-like domain-containing protein, partial [Nocardioidaceae bacterium]
LDVVAADGDTSTAGISYVLNIGQSHPTYAQLRGRSGFPNSLRDMIAVPSGTPREIADQARTVTEGADTNFDKAEALESWFRDGGGFEYSLDQDPTNGMDTIASFVTDDRRGYCEQFASAMAMMARTLKIPARVTIGFLSGDQVGDTYVFRGTDMHAWPELYLNEDVGWVAFEPTPSDRTGSGIEFGTPGGDEGSTTQERSDIPSGRTPTESGGSNTANLDNTDAGGGGDAGSGVPWQALLTTVLAVALLACLGAAPRWLRAQRRRRRWDNATSPVEAAEAAWAELRDTMRDLRLPWPEGATPRGTGRRIRPMVESREHAVDGLNRLVLSVERARYAEQASPVELRDDVEAIGLALASRVSKKTRRKATWMPLSLLGRIHLSVRRAGHEPRQHHELLSLEE